MFSGFTQVCKQFNLGNALHVKSALDYEELKIMRLNPLWPAEFCFELFLMFHIISPILLLPNWSILPPLAFLCNAAGARSIHEMLWGKSSHTSMKLRPHHSPDWPQAKRGPLPPYSIPIPKLSKRCCGTTCVPF